MHRYPAKRFSCSVCGTDASDHSGWYLVAENCWLDRLKVLDWHPVLAEQAAMRCVCGKFHLKTLITHWLTHANLQFLAAGAFDWDLATRTGSAELAGGASSLGRLVGELAIHREAISRTWSGSPEALECILNALIGGLGTKEALRPVAPALAATAAPALAATSAPAPGYAIVARAAEHSQEYALP
jgi:hypothetical protein